MTLRNMPAMLSSLHNNGHIFAAIRLWLGHGSLHVFPTRVPYRKTDFLGNDERKDSRYVMVCKPTEADTFLSYNRRVSLCMLSTILIICSVGLDVLFAYFIEIHDTTLFERYKFFEFYNLYGKIFRSILFYFLPLVISVLFYVAIARKLLSMISNSKRNNQLNKAFAITCVAWIFLWFPGAIDDFQFYIQHLYPEIDLSWLFDNKIYSTIMERSLDFKMIYSALNPLLFLFISKSFQNPLKDLGQRIGRIFCGRRNQQHDILRVV